MKSSILSAGGMDSFKPQVKTGKTKARGEDGRQTTESEEEGIRSLCMHTLYCESPVSHGFAHILH